MNESDLSLYGRMGGDAKIKEMIQAFYQRILMDQELAPFFASADIPKLIAMQQEFFSIAMDGPIQHSSRSLLGAHHGRGITRHHFSRFCNYLIETLLDFGMSQEDADRVLVRIAMYSGHVTGESGIDG